MEIKRKCHFKYCRSGKPATCVAYECDEAECFIFPVCRECLNALGMKSGDHYDNPLKIKKRLKAYYDNKLPDKVSPAEIMQKMKL